MSGHCEVIPVHPNHHANPDNHDIKEPRKW